MSTKCTCGWRKVAVTVLGSSPTAIRLTALLAGMALVPAVLALGWMLYGRTAGLVSVLGVHASSAPEIATLRDPWSEAAMADLFFHLVESGRMDVDALTTHRFAPEQAAEVYDALRRDRSGFLGVFLDWSRNPA